jgi:hypothetical protein
LGSSASQLGLGPSRVVLPVLALGAFGRYLPALVDWMKGSI